MCPCFYVSPFHSLISWFCLLFCHLCPLSTISPSAPSLVSSITVNTPAELHASKGDTVTLSCTFTSTSMPTSKMTVDWSYRPQTGGPPQTVSICAWELLREQGCIISSSWQNVRCFSWCHNWHLLIFHPEKCGQDNLWLLNLTYCTLHSTLKERGRDQRDWHCIAPARSLHSAVNVLVTLSKYELFEYLVALFAFLASKSSFWFLILHVPEANSDLVSVLFQILYILYIICDQHCGYGHVSASVVSSGNPDCLDT